MQFSSADRTTIVIRIPRKYRSIIRAFCIWLRVYPDQAGLWNCEEKLSQVLEQNESQISVATAYTSAMQFLQQNRRVG